MRYNTENNVMSPPYVLINHRFESEFCAETIGGQIIYTMPKEDWNAAPSFCKEVGIKESFQGFIVPGFNEMLKCKTLNDVLCNGFLSLSSLLMILLYRNIKNIRQDAFYHFC